MNSAQTLEEKLSPILIVDKEGIIGNALINKVKEEALVIFISENKPKEEENIIFIPFKNHPAKIPDNTYSHIVVIDDKFSWVRASLFSFAKKADDDKTSFTFVTDLDKKDKNLIENVSRFHRTKILILGEIFNEEKLLFSTIPNKLIQQAREEGRIDIPGDGTDYFYPVSFGDSIEGIINSVFGEDKNTLSYIFAKNPFSYLAFAHAIQRENPSIKIDFIKKEDESNNEPLVQEGKYLLGENYPIKEKIKLIKIGDFKLNKSDELPTETTINYKREKKKKYLFLKLTIFLLLIVLMPVIITLSTSLAGLKALEASKGELEKGDLKQTVNYSSFAANQFAIAGFCSKALLFETEKIGLFNYAFYLSEEINLGKSIAETETSILRAVYMITSANSSDSGSISALINDAKNSLEIYNKQTALNGANLSGMEKYGTLLSFASATTGIWDDLLGFNGERKYLILFQNNMELRPGGGFIGSYAVLTLDKGKIGQFTIHDVYDADGQLKGHVEPPFAIRRYLGKVHWYFRDSNFDVDFPKGAATSAYFLNLETGEKVNGVFAVDVSFVKNLMEAIGPVYVNDYKETVNAGNLFYLTESHAEKDFFPGSTQKKDFLRSLFNSILFQITSSKKVPFLSLAAALEKSLTEKHLLFAFDDQSVQSIFSLNNWSSAIPVTSLKNGEVVDFIGINEANIGANKANYFISRSISKAVTIDEKGEINSLLTINYKNSSDGKWPGGDYINYLRIIIPDGAEINEITIDEKAQNMTPAVTNFIQYESKTFKPPTGLEIEKYSEEGKTVYGFLVNIPAGKLKTIKINYSLGSTISLSNEENNYTFYFYKQPGTESFPVSFSLNLPNNLKFVGVPKNISIKRNQITLSTDATEDISTSVRIDRN